VSPQRRSLSATYSFRASFAFGRSSLLPHFLHRVARGAFRAWHFMQIILIRRRFSASGKRAIIAAKGPGLIIFM